MCKTPITIGYEDGEPIRVGCRKCKLCRANRVNDYVGRCIAEQQTACATYAVTLTYRDKGNGANRAVLTYADVQRFLKRLRIHGKGKYSGFQVRYIVAGEYGSDKGRCHWHAVLFFSCVGPRGPMQLPKVVDRPEDRGPRDIFLARWDNDHQARIEWSPWNQGFSYFQQPDFGGFQYCLKYALKNEDLDVSRQHMGASKQPPLGHEYFQDMALRHVDQGLAPRDLFYGWRDVRNTLGKPRQFMMQGVTRRLFLDRFASEWFERYGTPTPFNEQMEKYWDKVAGEETELAELYDDELAQRRRDQWPKYTRPTETVDWERVWAEHNTDHSDDWSYIRLCFREGSDAPPDLWEGPEGEDYPVSLWDGGQSYLAVHYWSEGRLKTWLVRDAEMVQDLRLDLHRFDHVPSP